MDNQGQLIGSEPADHWAVVLQKTYGLEVRLHLLVGEYDLNFRVDAGGERAFILKVMRPNCPTDLVDMQCTAHAHVLANEPMLPVPAVVPTLDGRLWSTIPDQDGSPRIVWLINLCAGLDYADYSPKTMQLIAKVGQQAARLNAALTDFDHSGLRRNLKWDLAHAEWICEHLEAIQHTGRRALIADIVAGYQLAQTELAKQPVQTIHNDLNDYNLMVHSDRDGSPRLSGIIDFGDMTLGAVVTELAVAGAYIVLGQKHPERALASLVAGYHRENALDANQFELIWPLLRMRLALSVVNSAMMKQDRPDDPYVSISETPAWEFLESTSDVDPALLTARLRAACGQPISDTATKVRTYLDTNRGRFDQILGCDLSNARLCALSVRDATLPQDPFQMTPGEAAAITGRALEDGPVLGYYGEPRLIYTDLAFRGGLTRSSDRRTIHIGIDVFMLAGTAVHTPLGATVRYCQTEASHLGYGGVVILEHVTDTGENFQTLYGHLDPTSMADLKPGQVLRSGQRFATLGEQSVNGGWEPHLHFQLSLIELGENWPGVADPDDRAFWQAICPNPAALLNLEDDVIAYAPLVQAGIAWDRQEKFATNLRLSYAEPCLFLRGWQHYLFDEWGRPYLDAYNNVPHVGHAHPRIRQIANEQLGRLNSNTRYLHPTQVDFAKTLLAKMPPHLTHVFFVNSGSEGNELALRLARAHTRGKHMITPDHGYHGNTTGAIDLSAYKFNKPGGGGAPDWVHIVPVADTYRGEHRGDDAAQAFASYVDERIRGLGDQTLAGFIAETFPSVGGQIIPPPGYLPAVYEKIRAAGGVCIADEVQTGLGRLGAYYWGFEQQKAQPDIVVLGKPLGNGHPMSAVVTTADIARSFDNGIEYFSTFGGSTLSCRTGQEVIRIVDDEGLQENARIAGAYLLAGLSGLQERHLVIGDVRGIGLFVGLDLVRDRNTREPATNAADYVKNRLRLQRILVGTEGPADNILKIRPPLTIQKADIDTLIDALDHILAETCVSTMIGAQT